MIEWNRMENGNQPATKQDLAEVRTEMKAMEDRLDDRMHSMEDRLIEAFRDSQTELLKAFYSFTESNRQRVSQLEGNQASLITRVGTLEDRITNLERKLITPPPTQ
jgi:chromosome segregation ATPase